VDYSLIKGNLFCGFFNLHIITFSGNGIISARYCEFAGNNPVGIVEN